MKAGYSDTVPALTPLQLSVARLTANGLTAAETARELHRSESTIWNVRASICARLNQPNMVAACVAAMRRGELH